MKKLVTLTVQYRYEDVHGEKLDSVTESFAPSSLVSIIPRFSDSCIITLVDGRRVVVPDLSANEVAKLFGYKR